MSNENKNIVGYLVFKRIRVEQANAISSPITYGFPAITGFLGAVHAMSRKVVACETENNISLGGVLIACHECQPQVFRTSSYADFTFNQTRNPIKRDGKTASIIEEGKCHLTVSLVVEVLASDDLFDEEIAWLEENTKTWIQQQRLAGGSVRGLAKYQSVTFLGPEKIESIRHLIMPAFVLMDAQQDLIAITEQLQEADSNATGLDALIDVCSLYHIPETNDKNEINWAVSSVKTGRGWLVPIPIGYQGISDVFDAGVMQHARNPEYSSQYVESIYGLGKWVFPHRIKNLTTAFWHYSHDVENSLYLTIQKTH